MKTAILVTFTPMTRVVMDIPDGKSAGEYIESDEGFDAIVRKAMEQMVGSPADYLCGDNVEEVKPDEECPYRPEEDEKYIHLGYFNDEEDILALAGKPTKEILAWLAGGHGHFYPDSEKEEMSVNQIRTLDKVCIRCEDYIITKTFFVKSVMERGYCEDDFIDIYKRI